MPFIVTMPKLSPTMDEGQIVRWHKKEGDHVEAGDLLLEVATDKATVEHNALDEGWLRKILLAEGSTVIVNAPIAIFTEEKEESIEGYTPVAASVSPVAEKPREEAVDIDKKSEEKRDEGERVVVSPLARRLARERGVDLRAITGSGAGGRIMSRDLPQGGVAVEQRQEKMSPMRKVIAKRLQEAKRSIPHFYVTAEIDAGAMVELKEQLASGHIKVSYNDMILHATALALKEHPVINSGFNEAEGMIIRFDAIDVAVAVSVEQGLITPIIRHADQKKMSEIADEVRELVQKARVGKLEEREYIGGSFTVSNLGMYNVKDFAAIINPPQAAILAVGGILPQAMVRDGNVFAGHSLMLTLSADHRVIDGVAAAKFMQSLKKLLENPALLVI